MPQLNKEIEKFDNDELIESFINGNYDYIRDTWKQMSYIDKDNYIIDIKSSYLSDDSKLRFLSILLRTTF